MSKTQPATVIAVWGRGIPADPCLEHHLYHEVHLGRRWAARSEAVECGAWGRGVSDKKTPRWAVFFKPLDGPDENGCMPSLDSDPAVLHYVYL